MASEESKFHGRGVEDTTKSCLLKDTLHASGGIAELTPLQVEISPPSEATKGATSQISDQMDRNRRLSPEFRQDDRRGLFWPAMETKKV